MPNDADVFDALKHRVEVDQHGTRTAQNSGTGVMTTEAELSEEEFDTARADTNKMM